MKYLEFRIHASRQGIEQVTALFMKCGIDTISIDDPEDMEDILNKKNEYGWDYIDDELKDTLDREPTASVYFEDTKENREFIQALKIEVMKLKSKELEGFYGWDVDFGRLYGEMIETDDSQWKDKWKEYFKPTKVTERIVVKPTWEEYEPGEGETVLEIDPGMAFGTGTHETTSLCMKLMEKYLGKAPEQKKVLDVGCGSGILSIGAALLGCRDVLGVEIDEDAAEVARENAEKNKVSDFVKIVAGDLTDSVDFEAHVILANLMADLVVKLAPGARKLLKDDGVFISSGILTEKEEMVSEAIKATGFTILEVARDGEWCAIAAR
ncbi:MAG: 50S ribosomal protein L11 methyltransferase [Clostridiales bacterium]|nr:50S ribosomal protein L11 methyltransferase [Clostridiales bacterium]